MICQAKFGDRAHQRNLIEICGTLDASSFFLKLDQKTNERNRTASDRRNQFLTGWETGVDNQLTPPKAAYTVKPIARQQQQQPSFLNKTGGGIRSKPFVFVQSLSSEGYLKCYTNEHSYLANLYASGTQQQQQLRQAPSISGFPVRLSSPPPFLSPPPPPQPRPQSPPPPQQAAARSGSAGSERVTRLFQQQTATSSAELEAAGSIGQQVDLVTKKIVPPSYFIISGRAKPEANSSGAKRLEPLTLLTERTMKFLTDSSENGRRAPAQEPRTGTPRLTHHSKPRVPTAERVRLRDFTSSHFGPALQQRLRLLTDAEVAAATAGANGQKQSASGWTSAANNGTSLGLEVSGVSRGQSRLSEASGGGGGGGAKSELQGLITAGLTGGKKSTQQQRWFESGTSAARPAPFVAAAKRK
ncbi:hypothetical protein BOX15_Mlig014824g1 [Macrostomum lignano]|uniref:Uncharacterized protein n=1 Tax=Macrostomum lignano TaxID=282301 RepID=A0A267EY82_9PLAT|nr:hypothetical protein BOX15_Mlig014824g1 [Macrostomum lignano]